MSPWLAIETSTSRGSLALWREGAPVAVRRWEQGVTRHQRLFVELTDFLREAATPPDTLARLVVGVGPGSFAGIRVALAGADGLALPGDVPVWGLCSAAATARAHAEAAGGRELAVVGDARRGCYWLARYVWQANGLHPLEGPITIAPDDLAAHLAPETRVLSADGARLGTALDAILGPLGFAPHIPVWPDAEPLVQLAREWHDRGDAPHPPQPIYLHPPTG